MFPLGPVPEVAGERPDAAEDLAEEAQVPIRAREPGEPTDEERKRHETTHLPFRSWCRYCVHGRLENPPHRDLRQSGPHDVPEVAMDYCFFSKEGGHRSLTVRVTKDRDSKGIIANPVLCKGRAYEDTVAQAVLNVRRFGHQSKVLLKTGNEPALVDLRRSVAQKLGMQVVQEAPPAYEPQSNGSVENAVKQVKGMVRTLMLALQARIQGEIPVDHPVMLWLVEHASELLTKHMMGHDGRTPYMRIFGKPCRDEGYEFGERIHFKRKTAALGSLDARWQDGIWLGRRWGTVSHIVAVGPD